MTEALRQAAENAADVLDEARTYVGCESWSPSMLEECERALRMLRAALAQHPASNPWREVIDAALIASGLDCLGPQDQPTEAVQRLIEWEHKLALDPTISTEAAALLNQQPPAPTAQPTSDDWKHLLPFGYAPGDYMMKCKGCAQTVSFVDKRALHCRPCAEKLHAAAQPVQQPGDNINCKSVQKRLAVQAAPAQRQPLSDEEIEAIWKAHVLPGFGERQKFYSPVVYARAIEAAHNITAAPAAQKGEKL